MIEFPQDGPISIGQLKTFLEGKLGEGTVSDQTLNKLFEKMQENQFQLPNAEVDENGASQAFIAPHKMSETYGSQAPRKEEGINYGDHSCAMSFLRNGAYFASFSNEYVDAPTTYVSPALPAAAQYLYPMVSLTTKHKLHMASGDNGLFPFNDHGNVDLGSWVFVDADFAQGFTGQTQIGSKTFIQVNTRNPSGGMYLPVQVNPGEEYYFQALDLIPNARYTIGNTPFGSEYADSNHQTIDNVWFANTYNYPFAYYTPDQEIIFISISLQLNSSSSIFFVGDIRTFEFHQYGNVIYPEIKFEIHNKNENTLPVPRMGSHDIAFNHINHTQIEFSSEDGSHVEVRTNKDMIFDEDTMGTYESLSNNVYIDRQSETSSYSGYSDMHTVHVIGLGERHSSQSRGMYQGAAEYALYSAFTALPVMANGGDPDACTANISAKFEKCHEYRVYYTEGSWNTIDNRHTVVHTTSVRQEAIDHWKLNYVNEGNFYLPHFPNKTFDWLHVVASNSSSTYPLAWIQDMQITSDVYEIAYSQQINNYSTPSPITGTLKLYKDQKYIYGSSTVFLSELEPKDVIVIDNIHYIVNMVISNELALLSDNTFPSSDIETSSASCINVNKINFPYHTAFPQKGFDRRNLKISPFYDLKINSDQKQSIDLAINKLESIVRTDIDVNMFFVPYEDARIGGTLAAAAPGVSFDYYDYIFYVMDLYSGSEFRNRIFKNYSLSQIYLQRFGTERRTNFDYLVNVLGTGHTGTALYAVPQDGVDILTIGLHLGSLEEGEFYKIQLGIAATKAIMISIKTTQNNETYMSRVIRSRSLDQTFVFTFQARGGDNTLELSLMDNRKLYWVTQERKLDFRFYGRAGSNTLHTDGWGNLSSAGLLSSGTRFFINGQILTVDSFTDDTINLTSNLSHDVSGAHIHVLVAGALRYQEGAGGWIDALYVQDVQIDRIRSTYVRNQINSAVVWIDQLDLNSLAANRILSDDKNGLYYIVLHEFLHALGMSQHHWSAYHLSDGIYSSSYPSQYYGTYGIQKYKEIIQEKINQLGLSNTLADYYTDSMPAQGGSAHLAKHAKLVNGKVQPSLYNELMTPTFDFERGVLSKITLGCLEDLGYEVDYNQIESSYLLEMSENTDISSDPTTAYYDQIIADVPSTKKRRTCPHCDHSSENET